MIILIIIMLQYCLPFILRLNMAIPT